MEVLKLTVKVRAISKNKLSAPCVLHIKKKDHPFSAVKIFMFLNCKYCTYSFLDNKFFNRPVNKCFLKVKTFYKGNVKMRSVFLNLHVYFDPKRLFRKISVIKIRNVNYQGKLDIQ